jgi:hypothetical protein
MLKPLAFASAVALAGAPAIAGPYANMEMNGSYQDGYQGSTTEAHIGYKGGNGPYGYYAQVGPAFVTPQVGGSDIELSGKIGGSVQASSNLNVYAEVGFITDDVEPAFGTKLGATWDF